MDEFSIEELIARDRADRVLIVAPAPLTVQWQEEMREKFDRNFVIYDSGPGMGDGVGRERAGEHGG